MSAQLMTSMERVLAALSNREADRVPFILPVTMHGAKELGLSLKEYFSSAENVAEGQMRMLKKYRHDALISVYYAAIEYEAFGGEAIFRDDGPANSGDPIVRKPNDILKLTVPDISADPRLCRVLETHRLLKERSHGETPILGIVTSPFSLPVMQMGFDRYINLLYEHQELFEHLMQVNEEFCVKWANAQLAAGATTIAYVDPVSSPTIITPEMYLKTGFPVAKRTIAQIRGPVAMHFASGRCLAIIDRVIKTGASLVSASISEDLGAMKRACAGRIPIIGNLNAIEMRRWSAQEAELKVKEAIAAAGTGGGYILSDNHGEIPFQVGEDTLLAVSEAVHTWGSYPLKWVGRDE